MLWGKVQMKRLFLASATLVLLGVSGEASAIQVTLTAHNTRSNSGTLITQKWATCAPVSATNPCYSTTNPWTLANTTGSTAVWDWDPGTGVLSMTGTFQTTYFISSIATGTSVTSDKVVNMVIDTTLDTTTAASYQCIEGFFLAALALHGCGNLDLNIDGDAMLNSTIAYNVGGNANCINRTIGGDDMSTGNVRGLSSAAAFGGCDATTGAFNLWTVASYTGPGGQLLVSNGINTLSPNTNYLTFSVVPVPTGVWLFGSALGVMGWLRRRTTS